MNNRRILLMIKWALQLTLAGIFLYSAVSKFGDIYLFGEVVRSYGLLPDGLIQPVAIGLPLAEILLALLLLVPQTVRWGAYGLALISVFFAFGLAVNWGEVLPYGCGCFGPTGEQTVGFLDVGKDLLFIAMALAIVWLDRSLQRR